MIRAAACATFVIAVPATAQAVLDQKPIGVNACGPCAIVNQLAHGDARLRKVLRRIRGASPAAKAQTLIDRFSAVASVAYKGKKAYAADRGMACSDLLAAVNGLLAKSGVARLAGGFLDRIEGDKGEDLRAHVVRIHGLLKRSIAKGVPPLFSLRSFAAKYDAKQKIHLWHGLSGHFVTIVSVQPKLRPNEKGFSFEFLDSFTGRKEFGYIAADEARNFTAAKGNSERWVWRKNRPFLLVTAPSLRLQTQSQPWYLRTLVTANYAIYAK